MPRKVLPNLPRPCSEIASAIRRRSGTKRVGSPVGSNAWTRMLEVSVMPRRVHHPVVLLVLLVFALTPLAHAQIRRPSPTAPPKTNAPQNRPKPLPSASPTASQPMKKASELISKQPPMATNAAILAKVTPDNSHVIVSLAKQRAYLM